MRSRKQKIPTSSCYAIDFKRGHITKLFKQVTMQAALCVKCHKQMHQLKYFLNELMFIRSNKQERTVSVCVSDTSMAHNLFVNLV